MLSAEMHGIFQHIISRDCSRVLGLDAHFSRSTLTERNLGYSTCQWIKGKHSKFWAQREICFEGFYCLDAVT